MNNKLKTCSVQNCNRSVYAIGYCYIHYTRYKRHGHPQTDKPIVERKKKLKKICSIPNCSQSHYAKGLCRFHYNQKRNKKRYITCKICNKKVFYSQSNPLPIQCPFCGSKYFQKRDSERHLFILQDKFFESNRDSKILGEMYTYLLSYVKSMIMKLSHFRFPKDILDEHTCDVASLVIEQYLKNPDFRIKISFSGYFFKKIEEVIYKNSKKEQITDSLDADFNIPHSNNHSDINSLDILGGLLNAKDLSGRDLVQDDIENSKNILLEDLNSTIENFFNNLKKKGCSFSERIILMCLIADFLDYDGKKFNRRGKGGHRIPPDLLSLKMAYIRNLVQRIYADREILKEGNGRTVLSNLDNPQSKKMLKIFNLLLMELYNLLKS